MNAIRTIQVGAAAVGIGMALAGVAQAGPNAQALRALEIRGQAMNDTYHLDALNALQIRSDTLNRRYHLGLYATSAPTGSAAALNALALRGRMMNERYQLGDYALVRQPSNGFDWADAAVGGAVVFGLVLIGGGVALGARRFRENRLRPA